MFPKYFRSLNAKVWTFSRRLFHSSRVWDSEHDIKKLMENSCTFEVKNPAQDRWYTPVYPGHSRNKRLQSEKAARPAVDPRDTSILLFPGQGSQFVGMAKHLLGYPNVKDMYECASEILKYNLLDLCLNGPEDMLNMTVHSQAAVMVASLAAVEKLKATNEKMIESCAGTAGFSVGEYAALVFAGAMEFEDAVRLLRVRGEAMQAASDMEPSGMMTVFLRPEAKIKLACTTAKEWCEKQTLYNAECRVAIYLFPDCRVISGHIEALKFLEANAEKFAIKKIKYLPVSGAFHSKLMTPARKVLEKALKTIKMELPQIPVYSNVTGLPYLTVDAIKGSLAKQLVEPVRWEQTMHVMFEREKGTKYPSVFECGPGTSLKSILRFNNNLAYLNCSNILA